MVIETDRERTSPQFLHLMIQRDLNEDQTHHEFPVPVVPVASTRSVKLKVVLAVPVFRRVRCSPA
jgi:hypothetical protein